jgi:long-chain acyl-CoA synthetase
MDTSSASFTNFGELFQYVTANYGTRSAIFWRTQSNSGKNEARYDSITGKKLKELVYLTARAFEKFNLNPGDRAAIISESRFEWVVADFACISNRLVTVPIYTTMTSSQIKYILEHSDSKICFASTQHIADKIIAVLDELPQLKYLITFNNMESTSDRVIKFEDLIYGSLIHSKESYKEAEADEYFARVSAGIIQDDLLTIIYTSGTTGTPKGICLSHKNILSNIKSILRAVDIGAADRFLSFLPLAHSYERTTGYYTALCSVAEIYYAKNVDTLPQQLVEVKPTLFTSVPLLYSRIYLRLMKNIDAMPLRKQFMAKWALKIGMRYRNKKNSFMWKLADRIVLKKIRERTGGKFRIVISGGSALNREIAEFFDSAGITILQGYGLTETSPVISVNRPDKNKFGTVGPPLDGVEVKIAEDGEILVRGDTVMLGYYKNESETYQTIVDGWLHTGDIGELDKDNFLKVTDRKKSLIKTESGEYISLTHIEETLTESQFIDQAAALVSDERHFVSALIVPNFDEVKSYARSNNISFNHESDIINSSQILKLIESEIGKVQSKHAKYERVRKFVLLTRPFTIESGELTPSLKIKKKVIEENYKDVIGKMYSGK